MKKIVCITGTRPQLIKHAVLAKALQTHFDVESLYTGQHYDYSLHEGLKKELFPGCYFYNLRPERRYEPGKRLGDMLLKTADFLKAVQPDAVLVYGDTDTTLAGALAANKMRIPLVHVEAGERSYNRAMPEEHNRVATDALADVLFCASQRAQENLQREANRGTILYSGDLMKDLLLRTAKLFQTPIIEEAYAFCTIHRDYTNQNAAKLEDLLYVLNSLNCLIIFPVHPATQETVEKLRTEMKNYCKIHFLPPVAYHDSIRYQKFANAVITDSGGIQKEAYWLQRRCITIRPETEWTDTLNGAWNQLAYENLSQIPVLLQTSLGAHDIGLYGDGNAATQIAEHLQQLI